MFRRRKTPPLPPSVQFISKGPERIEFLWIRGAGRRIRIDVAPDGRVCVHSPAGASLARVLPFVAEKAGWILRAREKVNSRTRLSWPVLLCADDEFFWAGRPLRVEESAGPRFSVRIESDRFVLVRPPSGEATRAARRAGLRLRAEAERALGERVAARLPVAEAFDLPKPRVSFRMMKRRWGSCGRDGRVVLNLRLAQLPETCADYVILHELCHLRHHHHGRAFYDLLARVCPDWKDRKKSLERYILI
ncbi:MAG: M48 family metallopeptidase [Candidatus Aminicenantales bacterium]